MPSRRLDRTERLVILVLLFLVRLGARACMHPPKPATACTAAAARHSALHAQFSIGTRGAGLLHIMWRPLSAVIALAWTAAVRAELDVRQLYHEVMRKMDNDGDGQLTVLETKRSREKWIRSSLHAQYLAFADRDHDGIISRDEFEELMVNHQRVMSDAEKDL